MTDRLVVDTDVISFIFKRDSRAAQYEKHLRGKQAIVSFVTVAELFRWSVEKNWGAARRQGLNESLRNFIVYPSDLKLCETWAQVLADATREGNPIAYHDAWIASTAICNNVPLVTNNAKDFTHVKNLTVISESEVS